MANNVVNRLRAAAVLALATLPPALRSQACTSSSPGANPTIPDYSGVSAVDSLPVPAGGAVHYKCPGVKTFKGKHDWSLTCLDDLSLAFVPVLGVWPECQCDLDMAKTECAAGNYTTVYQDDAGDVAGAILTLKLPKHTKDFTVSLRMDSAIRGMKPRAEGADANLIVTGDDMMRVVPTASAELSEEEMRIDLSYDLNAPGQTLPRYAHPCVVSISCDFDARKEGWSSAEVWIFLGCAAAAMIILMCFCFLLCYFLKNHGKQDNEVEPIGVQYGDDERF